MKPKTKGTTLILISAVFFASYGVWSRLMSGAFGEFTQAWTRGLMLLIVVLLINWKLKLFKPIAKPDFKWFLLIALAGGLNQAPYYYGFEHLEIGTATLFFYAALVFGGYIIGKLIFSEKITPVKYISLGLSFIGMFIIYRLSLTTDQIFPATLTVAAGLMGAIGAVLPKKLSHDYPELQIMTGYFIVMFIANSALAYIRGETLPPFTETTAWLAQLGYATSLMIANFAVIQGFKYLEASVGSLIGMTEILFGALFGALLFNESLPATTILGGLLIITAATLPNLKRFTHSTAGTDPEV